MSLFEDSGMQPRAVAVNNPWRVPFDGSLTAAGLKRSVARKGVGNKAKPRRIRDQLENVQEIQCAGRQFPALCVFQALGDAGKDGTIRWDFSGLNPSCVKVASLQETVCARVGPRFSVAHARQLHKTLKG